MESQIAYVTSLFPNLTETFILREVGQVERAGIPVAVFSIRARPAGPICADAQRYRKTTYYAPWMGIAHLGAFLSLLVRRPAGVARGLAFLFVDCISHIRYPEVILKTLVCTAKMFLLRA